MNANFFEIPADGWIPIFHHGGRFVRNANGDRRYVDGQVTRFSAMDVDFVNKGGLLELAKEIGYIKINEMFWQEHVGINFEAGLHSLVGDKEINEMCEYTLNHNLKEFHIYLDHPVDVPIMPDPDPTEEPIAVESSSSNSYESAEDEAYKPPPPEPNRKKFLTPKKKKRFADKRTKKHVLSGEGSSGAGSGWGSGHVGGPEVGNSSGPRSVGDENANPSP
ncbi:hypothetical protein PIB30_083236, partial [Stylosanthes scabra]|nr:hypothetical protein [Stylosanthes scabra]